MSELLEKLKKTDNISYEQILNKLMEKTDISLKTELVAPLEVTIMEEIGNQLKIYGYLKSSVTVLDFVDRYKQNMVSYKRMGRKEIADAVSSKINNSLTSPEVRQK